MTKLGKVTRAEGRVSRGSVTPAPEWAEPQGLQSVLGPLTLADTVGQTATKFCMANCQN